jgi:hypothetical protein
MIPSPQQLILNECHAVVAYLERYRLSQKDFATLIFKRKEVTLEEAERMVEEYAKRYPAIKQLFLKS